MSSQRLTLVWFRQDLRLADNPALSAAAAAGTVLPVYILDDVNAGAWKMGSASRAWLNDSLQALDRSLDGRLQLFRGDARTIIATLFDSLPIDAVYWNRCYEPWRIERDAQIKSDLAEQDIEAHSYNASLLWEPWTSIRVTVRPTGFSRPTTARGACHCHRRVSLWVGRRTCAVSSLRQ